MRTGFVAMAAGLGLALAACGGGNDEPAEAAPIPPPAEDTSEVDTAAAPDATPPASPAAGDESAPAAEFAGLPEPYASADFSRGKRVFLQCQSCHTLEEGGPVVLGPNLHGLFSRKVGEGSYDYSEALQEADFEWTPEQLDEWLARPRDFLPGNKMSFAGLTRPDDRTAVIAYIMSQTGYEASE